MDTAYQSGVPEPDTVFAGGLCLPLFYPTHDNLLSVILIHHWLSHLDKLDNLKLMVTFACSLTYL